MNLLLWEATRTEQVQGGPAALVAALEQAAISQGVEIRTNAEVTGIVLSGEGAVEGQGLVELVGVEGKVELHLGLLFVLCF